MKRLNKPRVAAAARNCGEVISNENVAISPGALGWPNFRNHPRGAERGFVRWSCTLPKSVLEAAVPLTYQEFRCVSKLPSVLQPVFRDPRYNEAREESAWGKRKRAGPRLAGFPSAFCPRSNSRGREIEWTFGAIARGQGQICRVGFRPGREQEVADETQRRGGSRPCL